MNVTTYIKGASRKASPGQMMMRIRIISANKLLAPHAC